MTYKLHSACIGRDGAIAKILDVHKYLAYTCNVHICMCVGMLMHLNYIYTVLRIDQIIHTLYMYIIINTCFHRSAGGDASVSISIQVRRCKNGDSARYTQIVFVNTHIYFNHIYKYGIIIFWSSLKFHECFVLNHNFR